MQARLIIFILRKLDFQVLWIDTFCWWTCKWSPSCSPSNFSPTFLMSYKLSWTSSEAEINYLKQTISSSICYKCPNSILLNGEIWNLIETRNYFHFSWFSKIMPLFKFYICHCSVMVMKVYSDKTCLLQFIRYIA